jgi:nitrite reductase (NADH) large subunit
VVCCFTPCLFTESHIIEFADILMCRQIDAGGHNALVGKIEAMGLKVHCGARTASFVGTDGTEDNDSSAPVSAVRFSNDGWDDLPVQMVIVSAGIKPRDELALAAGIAVGERGGVIVNEQMQTSDPNVYAVGEIALYNNFIYGLIAPGYTMANVAAKGVAAQLGLLVDQTTETTTALPAFTGADMSTKLKLLGCDVASFGENQPRDMSNVSELVWNDPIKGVYRKLIFDKAGRKLRGGILVGDASDYELLHKLAVLDKDAIVTDPASLLPPPSARGASTTTAETAEVSEDPATQICSCNDVTRGDITKTIIELGKDQATLAAVKKCSKAGTGCGGCEPQGT